MQKKPTIKGPSQEELDRQKAAEERANAQETRANEQISSTARASYGRRTGRRILIAPGRENAIGTIGGGSSGSGTSGTNI